VDRVDVLAQPAAASAAADAASGKGGDIVSQAVATGHVEADTYQSPLTPESWSKLGMWVFLAGDAMSFGGLLAAYGAMRYSLGACPPGVTTMCWPLPSNELGVALTGFMTFLLICSSVTMVKALAACQDGERQKTSMFLGLTILGGIIFLGLQAYEWTHLIHSGLGLSANPWGAGQFGTTFFMTTGFHGCHVFAGVCYLTAVLIKNLRGGYSRTNSNGIETAGLYWHFVDLIWILVFTFIYLV
jgi:heme/copper-type cytochrome/quinol oxidase subunit 3